MSYEIMKNDYGRFVLFRTPDFYMIASGPSFGPLDALRKDLEKRAERAKNAHVPVRSRTDETRQGPKKNVGMSLVRA
jgi:hypothetical protein